MNNSQFDYQRFTIVSYTQPSEQLTIENSQINDLNDLVAFCARVSSKDNQHNTKTSEKLLNYLIKHKHWSPFEMVNICAEVITTRDIARQILRHRSFSFQEFSQRYADPTKDLDFVVRPCRLQDNNNRQNSIVTEDDNLIEMWNQYQNNIIEISKKYYQSAIACGIAKEQARALLPEGLVLSKMYINGSLRSWIHYIDVRSSNGTQAEHADIAVKACYQIAKIFPQIISATGDVSNG
jgi:thymidylate synthase (FAD)